MLRVTSVSPLTNFGLAVELEDGTTGTLNLSDELSGPIFEPLRQVEAFNQVRVDEFGVICWPNGADLAPEFVLAQIRKKAATHR